MPKDSQSLLSESTSQVSSIFSQIPISKNRRSTRQLIASNNTESIINSSNVQKLKKLNFTWRKGNFSQDPEFIKCIRESPNA